MSINVIHLENPEQIVDALAVRAQVFQGEQGISAYDDFDGRDGTAEQFVAYDDDQPVGTARYRVLEGDIGKIERVAVLSNQRGKNVGHAIMLAIHETAAEQQLTSLVLESQLSAEGFYTSLGYSRVGEEFDEVGIPHVKMSLQL